MLLELQKSVAKTPALITELGKIDNKKLVPIAETFAYNLKSTLALVDSILTSAISNELINGTDRQEIHYLHNIYREHRCSLIMFVQLLRWDMEDWEKDQNFD